MATRWQPGGHFGSKTGNYCKFCRQFAVGASVFNSIPSFAENSVMKVIDLGT